MEIVKLFETVAACMLRESNSGKARRSRPPVMEKWWWVNREHAAVFGHTAIEPPDTVSVAP